MIQKKREATYFRVRFCMISRLKCEKKSSLANLTERLWETDVSLDRLTFDSRLLLLLSCCLIFHISFQWMAAEQHTGERERASSNTTWMEEDTNGKEREFNTEQASSPFQWICLLRIYLLHRQNCSVLRDVFTIPISLAHPCSPHTRNWYFLLHQVSFFAEKKRYALIIQQRVCVEKDGEKVKPVEQHQVMRFFFSSIFIFLSSESLRRESHKIKGNNQDKAQARESTQLGSFFLWVYKMLT